MMRLIVACDRCGVMLVKRLRPPKTASKNGPRHWDYYQCPKCKVNIANPKKVEK